MGISLVSPFIFFPPKPPTYGMKKPKEVLMLKTKKEGLDVPTYIFKKKKNHPTKTDYTLILSHGNASDIGGFYKMMVALNTFLPYYNFISYDFYGYGVSKKKKGKAITPKRLDDSLEAVIDHCVTDLGIPKSKIVLMGISVGTGVTCDVSTAQYRKKKRKRKNRIEVVDEEEDFAGIVLQSCFTSGIRVFQDIVKNFGIVNCMCGLSCNCCCCFNSCISYDRKIDPFQNMRNIRKIKSPVFLLNGQVDRTVPIHHSNKIYENIPDKYKYKNIIVPGAGHNNIVDKMSGKVFIKEMQDFFDYLDDFHKNGKRPKERKEREKIPGDKKKGKVLIANPDDPILYQNAFRNLQKQNEIKKHQEEITIKKQEANSKGFVKLVEE